MNILVPVLTVYVVCVWGLRLLAFFAPFVIGWIVAMIANPLVRFLEKKIKLVRKHSSMVLIVGVLALVIFGLYFLLGWCFREAVSFVKALPGIYDAVREEVTAAYGGLGRILSFLPADLENSFEQIMDSMGTYIGELLQDAAALAGGAVARTLPEVFVNVIVVLLSSYLFLAEHDALVLKVKGLMPPSVKKYAAFLKKDVRTVISGYFLAQFKIMFVVAVVLFIGLCVLGVRYSAVIAVGIAVLDFLPMFGTGTVLIPWAVVKLFTGEYAYAAGLALLYVLTQALRQIIQPKIVGDSMGLPPLTTLFLLYLGFKFRGIAGMILAVPVGIVFIKFYEYGAFDSFIRHIKLLIEEIQKLRTEETEKNGGSRGDSEQSGKSDINFHSSLDKDIRG